MDNVLESPIDQPLGQKLQCMNPQVEPTKISSYDLWFQDVFILREAHGYLVFSSRILLVHHPQNLGSLLGMSPRLRHPHVIGRHWRDRLKGKTKFNRNHKLQTTQLKIVGKIQKREFKMLKVWSHKAISGSLYHLFSRYVPLILKVSIAEDQNSHIASSCKRWAESPQPPQFGHSIDSSQSNSSWNGPKKGHGWWGLTMFTVESAQKIYLWSVKVA